MAKEKETNKKNNTALYVMIGVGIVVVLGVVIFVISNLSNNSDDKKGNNTNKNGVIEATEESIEKEYGYTKEDAIKVVKENYKSDNYEFSATIRKDNKYIVTVKNTLTKSETKYVVDPNDGSWTLED